MVSVAAILVVTALSIVFLNFDGDGKTKSIKKNARFTMHVSDEMIKTGAVIHVKSILLPHDRMEHLNSVSDEGVTHVHMNNKWNIIYFFYEKSKEPIYSFVPSNGKRTADPNDKIFVIAQVPRFTLRRAWGSGRA